MMTNVNYTQHEKNQNFKRPKEAALTYITGHVKVHVIKKIQTGELLVISLCRS